MLTQLKGYNDETGDCYWECVWEKSPGFRWGTCCTYMGTNYLDAGSPHLYMGTCIYLSVLILLTSGLRCSNRIKFTSQFLYRLTWSLAVTQTPRT